MSTNDATPTVLGLTEHQAVALFCAHLLSGDTDRFGTLLSESKNREQVLAGTGPLLMDRIGDRQFIKAFAGRLVGRLQAIVWVELTARLIRTLNCAFQNFGVFNGMSFNSALLLAEASACELTCLASPAKPKFDVSSHVSDAAIDALCRLVMEKVRKRALKGDSEFSAAFQTLPGVFLESGLMEIFSNLRPPSPDVMSVLSLAATFASYYAWVFAFGIAIYSRPVIVPGVGSFSLPKVGVVSNVSFVPERSFRDLIDANPPHLTKAA